MLRPPRSLTIENTRLHSAMDQFASERNAQELSIRCVSGARNHECHCRNAVAFACFQGREFTSKPFLDFPEARFVGTFKVSKGQGHASLRQSEGVYQGGQSGGLVTTAGVIEKISRE